MRQRHLAVPAVLALLGTGVSIPAGCSRPKNPWVYAEPPAVHVNAYARPAASGRPVIAVAEMTNPDAPQLPWPDVGAEMTRALRRALFNQSDFEVRIDPEIEAAVSKPGYLMGAPDPSVKKAEVDYVLTGQVTDFHHTALLPKDVSRWGIIGRRKEAVVAIQWRMIDVRRHRLVAADHTYGVAEAKRKNPIEEQYAGLDISAYLFWNTPLGRAARDCVDTTIDRVRALLPSRTGEPVITELQAGRKIEVSGGVKLGLAKGQDLFVAVADARGARQGVMDVDTGRPLMVRIGDVRRDDATAWLLGKPPPGVELRGAALVVQQPPGLATGTGQSLAAGTP